MTLWGFLIAKLLQNESWISARSASTETLFAELKGKRVALIGNARKLAESRLGPEIDMADIVIRVNSAPIPSGASHGMRTDWLGVSMPPSQKVIRERFPSRILWMTRKRKRLPFWLCRMPGFYLKPRPDSDMLARDLGAPPTTGLMLIDLLARSDVAEVRLYGFDFFASLSLSGRRAAADVPHDFAAERAWVEALLTRDPRFRLITPI